jgi:hypothetical protein
MKAEGKAKSERGEFFFSFILHPSSFILALRTQPSQKDAG